MEDMPMPVEAPSADTLKAIYTRMWRIRLFEEQAEYQSSQGKVMGALHTYIGEEAVAVPVCAHLQDTDYITSTHRGHGHCIAKGADIKRMMAELFGRATGYCKGLWTRHWRRVGGAVAQVGPGGRLLLRRWGCKPGSVP
jgi:TPP-dependent pyruvate/acetoin dehydrogenase alpha subunit